jgi:hypothetical protein
MVAAVSSNDEGRGCFGFQVRSRCAFRFLRRAGGEDTLHVSETTADLTAPGGALIAEWILPDPVTSTGARLYRTDGTFHFWTGDAGWYRIDPAARAIEMSPSDDEVRREQRLWGVPTVLCFMERGDFGLHAAAVEVDGRAIVLAAPGRHGKTTLALGFHRFGYRLLTEDTTCCRLATDPLLLPGPTSVRVRPDVFPGEAPPATTIVSVRDDRIHLMVDADRAGDIRPVPIRAIVFLREPAEAIRLERVKPGEALPDLWALNFHLQNTLARGRSFSQLAQLAAAVGIWNLHRPLSLASLEEVVSRIVETCEADV